MTPRESTDLGATGAVHNGHVGPEHDLMPLVANLAERHQWPRHCRYLEDARKVSPDRPINEVERLLSEVGDRAAVNHEEFLTSPTARRLNENVDRTVIRRADVNDRAGVERHLDLQVAPRVARASQENPVSLSLLHLDEDDRRESCL